MLMMPPRLCGPICWLAIVATLVCLGCNRAPVPSTDVSERVISTEVAIEPVSFEAAADDLLGQRLPAAQTSQGWVRLFDGYTLFGWQMASAANWRVEDRSIVVDAGMPGLLCTSVGWADFELTLEFSADAESNSGVFVRTPLEPTDPAVDCYEINIAPASNPFPTGSIVGRQKCDAVERVIEGTVDADAWHTYKISVVGDVVTTAVDDAQTCRHVDPTPLPAGRIGLQFNQGRVAFRNIRVRPIGLRPTLNAELGGWKKFPDKPGEFRITDDAELLVTGGRGQIESEDTFGNFVALVESKTRSEKLNSGIFFRCIKGSEMDGYECQIQNGIVDDNPFKPVDCGTGGIFRRSDARILAADDGEWFNMVMVADGLQIATWVNGLQVTDWVDTRAPNANPRNGSRQDAGSIMIQAHDPTTDILFRKIDVGELIPRSPKSVD